MKLPIAILLLMAIITCGCSSSTYWANPHVPPNLVQSQFAIDHGRCVEVAYKDIQVPQVKINSSGYQGTTTFNGSANSYNPYVWNTDTQYSGQAYSQGTTSNPFTTGMANGMNMRAARDAEKARQSIYNGCMASLGWTEVEVKSKH
ncbi:MAG: hypothetical protein ACREF7_00935 [Candidatus Saccharimonadales bacterium]